MYAVEFQAVIRNGMISVPPRYQSDFPSQVRVILMTEQTEPVESGEDIIDRLLKSPRYVGSFKPMSREEIYER